MEAGEGMGLPSPTLPLPLFSSLIDGFLPGLAASAVKIIHDIAVK